MHPLLQLRARADFRFALDPTNMPQNAGERSTIKGLAQTALRCDAGAGGGPSRGRLLL